MKAGIDFPSLFVNDNFTSRRTTGHNLHDPDSLITGAEIEAGFTFANSTREWNDQAHYLKACLGDLTSEEIAQTAPRIFISTIQRSLFVMAAYDHEEAA